MAAGNGRKEAKWNDKKRGFVKDSGDQAQLLEMAEPGMWEHKVLQHSPKSVLVVVVVFVVAHFVSRSHRQCRLTHLWGWHDS